MKLYVLYENPDWMPPLRRELDRAGVPYEEWYVERGHVDPAATPPEGIFLNRVSPSSHTRGHLESIDLARETIAWLESHGRRVINGGRAFAIETSKIRQYALLERMGIRAPRTIGVAGGPEELRAAAKQMALPFITKHNCGGKGLGVQFFRSLDAFAAYIHSPQFVPSPDNITLLQEYVEPRNQCITRVEIVNGQFLYAINVSTERGFQLCPAEACEISDAFCPTADRPPAGPAFEDPRAFDRQSLFTLRAGFDHPIVARYIRFMKTNGIDIAGIEFIEDRDGNLITYDINTTTNYSPGVETAHDLNGMAAIASFLKSCLPPHRVCQTFARRPKAKEIKRL